MTFESNTDTVFFTKLSKMNTTYSTTLHTVYTVQPVTSYYGVGPNTLALTAGLCPLNTSISFVISVASDIHSFIRLFAQ